MINALYQFHSAEFQKIDVLMTVFADEIFEFSKLF